MPIVLAGRALMTVGSKLGYWGRLRAFSTTSFSKAYRAFSSQKSKFGSTKSGAAFNKFMESKLGRTIEGLTGAELAYQGIQWMITEDEDSESVGQVFKRVSLLSLNSKTDTFVKYLATLIDKDEVLNKRLGDWDCKLYIASGSNDKSCRIMVKPKRGSPKVLSSFCVTEWINNSKSSKGDLKRLSDVLEYEYFHSFYGKGTGYITKQRKAVSYRDNVLISDELDINKIKATMGYSALLYDLQKLSQGTDTLSTSKLPTINDLDKELIEISYDIDNTSYTKKVLKKMTIAALTSTKAIDVTGLTRSNMLKRNIMESVANTDFQDAAIIFVHEFMSAYVRQMNLVVMPTKFKSEDFDGKGVRSTDNYKAYIINEIDDLDNLGNILVDKRSKISGSPGMDDKKIAVAKQFIGSAVKTVLSPSSKNDGAGVLTGLMDAITAN